MDMYNTPNFCITEWFTKYCECDYTRCKIPHAHCCRSLHIL